MDRMRASIQMFAMQHRIAASVVVTVFMSACSGDDGGSGLEDTGDTGGTTGGDGGPDDTAGPVTTATDTADATGTDTGGATADESGDTTGGPVPTACTPSVLPGALEAGQWDDRFTLAGLTGRDGYFPIARDVVSDVDGSVLVAGYFRWGDGAWMEGLARWQDGAWTVPQPGWADLEVPPEGFSAIAVGPAGELALASTDLAGDGDGVVWLDTGDGPELIAQHAGVFRRLLWFDGELWGAGTFAIDGGPAGLARWDGAQWQAAPGGGPDAAVFELTPDLDGGLLVGGEFSQVGGIAAERVARWDGAQWEAMSMPQTLRVLALEHDGEGTLYAGGSLVLDDENIPSASLARWTGTGWEIAAGGVAFGEAFGAVGDLLYRDGSMYVAGCFDAVGGGVGGSGPVEAAGLARLADGVWEALDAGLPFGSVWFEDQVCGFEPNPGAVFAMTHQRLHHDGERLWLVGGFAGKDGAASRSVVVQEGGEWQPAGTAGLGLSGQIGQLAVGGPRCDVLGLVQASHAGSEPLTGALARFDAVDGWVSASPPPPPGLQCLDFALRASGEAVLGCSSFEGEGSGEVFVLVDGAWQSAGTLPGAVHDLEVAPDDSVWIAGGGATGYVAQLRDDGITVIEDGFDLLVLLVDVAAPDDEGYDVVAGGPFTAVDGQPVARIARWGGESWQPLGEGLAATPSAIEATADVVYAGTWDEGTPERLVLGRFADGTWTELGDPAHGLPDPFGFSSHTFTALVALDDGLVAVGYVWPETGGRNAYHFDGEQLTAIGGGIAAISVDDVVLTGRELLFAGSIAEVGPEADPLPSVGTARFAWPR
jgi:hypothetical protein